MKAPVGLLSGRAVCVSRWRGVAPTSSAERSKRIFTGEVVEGNGSCRAAFCESAALREAPLPSSPAAMPPSPRGRLFAVAGNFAAAPKGAPLGELAKPQALTEGVLLFLQKKKPLHKNCAMVSLVTVSNSQSRIRRAPELPSQLRRRGERRS